jgi:hypothetical protein
MILLLILVCARYLIGSVAEVVASSHITTNFTGLILLLILTNMSNYIKTYAVAYEGRMDLAVALTLGTSVDIAFFTLPILLLLERGDWPAHVDAFRAFGNSDVSSKCSNNGGIGQGWSKYLFGRTYVFGIVHCVSSLMKFEKSIH